jgi:DNA helicase-2/ATP-dependent DNA helicase PcrA
VNRARVRCISLREEYDKSRESFGWWELERVERALSAYKEQNGLRDFTDMLVEYLDRGAVPVLEALFVDEAQDLSALQWMLIRHLMKETEARVYIAGDDDQAIFRWAGADVETFVDLAGEVNVLRQSYRVPRAVQRVASGLVQRIGHRRPKDWVARPEAGSVHYAMRPEQVDMSDGTWLVLARNKMQLRGLSDWCRRHGWHYSWFHEPSVSQKMLDAVTSWEAFRKERKDDDWKRACEYITNGQQKALSASRNLGPWFESLDRISHADREYIRAILRRGGRIGGVPRIALSTIHSAKGGEADHVLLLTDILRRSHDEMRRFPDDEVRVFYVGATRARESLHIVKPRTKFYFKI